jgi:hypothetical protein
MLDAVFLLDDSAHLVGFLELSGRCEDNSEQLNTFLNDNRNG